LSLEVTRFRPRWRQAGTLDGPRWLEGFDVGFSLRRRRGGLATPEEVGGG